ncbi:hypothetical protein SEA_RANDO14_87 [Mycobacterium phage Rando14]|nr:hypothetical protein I5G75_gp09 [Mycobacterium phage Rando14]AXQ53107.1 hypothetical protein SEA_RANDO14_87 [Mycobacterium phage Rando14]
MAKWVADRAEHLARHDVTIEQAEEALNDAARVTLDPDPASKSGRGVRVIGYSPSAGTILCVLTVVHEGVLYGSTAYPANGTYRRIYHEGA